MCLNTPFGFRIEAAALPIPYLGDLCFSGIGGKVKKLPAVQPQLVIVAEAARASPPTRADDDTT